ncbi:hypothetical protein [Arthrobacter sp. NA-172]|uniref:hypothetical protein n=1 Tax=Arthrobacter sp. NA-172 TaxID=3367524 RepID=UPI00375488E7
MAEMNGQTDIFELLECGAPLELQPLFKVRPTGWYGKPKCGWCGSTNTIGGGACRHPQNRNQSIGYDYCQRCVNLYGHPHVNGRTPIIMVTADDQRIMCPFCRSIWGFGLKPEVLARIATEHAPASDGLCAHMEIHGRTEPYYAPGETPWLPEFIIQFPRPKGCGGLSQMKGGTFAQRHAPLLHPHE